MIHVEGFQKTFQTGLFKKKSQAAVNISLEVSPGEVHGFLGPNGAGKTTTIKALLGLIRPDKGSFKILGEAPSSLGWRAKVGYMPEHPTFYDYLSGFEMVAWFGGLAGMSKAEAEAQAKRGLERVGLGSAMHRRLRSYSKGMLQRAGLAQAIMNSPELLILDEPMTGLDPIGRKEIRDLILELRDEGKTIFYSTHILPDVEQTCDRVSILYQGETKKTGRLEDILNESDSSTTITFDAVPEALLITLKEKYPSARIHNSSIHLNIEDSSSAHSLAAELSSAGATLKRFEPHREDLEAIFLRSLN